jgi:hypothetical protein
MFSFVSKTEEEPVQDLNVAEDKDQDSSYDMSFEEYAKPKILIGFVSTEISYSLALFAMHKMSVAIQISFIFLGAWLFFIGEIIRRKQRNIVFKLIAFLFEVIALVLLLGMIFLFVVLNF